jgi:hypothetical protein
MEYFLAEIQCLHKENKPPAFTGSPIFNQPIINKDEPIVGS